MEAKKAAGAPGVPACPSDTSPGQVGRGRRRRKKKVLGPQEHQESSLGRSLCLGPRRAASSELVVSGSRNLGFK